MACNPLGVVRNSAQQPRLIVDLRYVNKHLRSRKFKYEDIRTAADLFSKGDRFYKFDKVATTTWRFFHNIANSLVFLYSTRISLDIFILQSFFSACPWVLISLLRFKEHLSNTGEVNQNIYILEDGAGADSKTIQSMKKHYFYSHQKPTKLVYEICLIPIVLWGKLKNKFMIFALRRISSIN